MFKRCPLRILIVDGDLPGLSDLRAQLSGLGYLVAAETADMEEALRLAQQLCPDAIVMNLGRLGLEELEACLDVDREELCPIVLLSESSNEELIRKACSLLAVESYLAQPVSERNLEPAIELAMARFRPRARPAAARPAAA